MGSGAIDPALISMAGINNTNHSYLRYYHGVLEWPWWWPGVERYLYRDAAAVFPIRQPCLCDVRRNQDE